MKPSRLRTAPGRRRPYSVSQPQGEEACKRKPNRCENGLETPLRCRPRVKGSRTPVRYLDYKLPFRFTAKLDTDLQAQKVRLTDAERGTPNS
jgi:hypothetical protein